MIQSIEDCFRKAVIYPKILPNFQPSCRIQIQLHPLPSIFLSTLMICIVSSIALGTMPTKSRHITIQSCTLDQSNCWCVTCFGFLEKCTRIACLCLALHGCRTYDMDRLNALLRDGVQLSQKDTTLSIWVQFHDFGQTIKLDTNGICDFIISQSLLISAQERICCISKSSVQCLCQGFDPSSVQLTSLSYTSGMLLACMEVEQVMIVCHGKQHSHDCCQRHFTAELLLNECTESCKCHIRKRILNMTCRCHWQTSKQHHGIYPISAFWPADANDTTDMDEPCTQHPAVTMQITVTRITLRFRFRRVTDMKFSHALLSFARRGLLISLRTIRLTTLPPLPLHLLFLQIPQKILKILKHICLFGYPKQHST
jgi:hypothetical protein